MTRIALLFALSCGSSAPPPPANTAMAPTAISLAGDERCHQAVDYMDQLAANVDDPAARHARLQVIQEAHKDGVLGDQTVDCTKHWTNGVVDCVLAALDSAAAKACIPAT